MHCSQSRGVTVAQVILVHFVEVRILTGLPFFCLFSGGLGKNGRESFRKELVSGLAKRNFRRHSNYQQSPSARRPKRRTCPTCPTGPTQAPPQRRLRANDAIQSLYCLRISQAFIRHSNYQQSPSARRTNRLICSSVMSQKGMTVMPEPTFGRANAGIQSLCCQIHLSSQTFTDDHGQVDCFDSIKQQRQFRLSVLFNFLRISVTKRR